MANTSIRLYPQNGPETVTAISCDYSFPRIGGTIDISAFTNLASFSLKGNDITAITGYSNNANLTNFIISDNRITGSMPVLSSLTNLVHLQYNRNLITGSIPVLSSLTNLETFYCNSNSHTGSIPDLSGLTRLITFHCSVNYLSGSIPNLSSLTNLVAFECTSNNRAGVPGTGITGFSGSVNSRLGTFQAQVNRLTQGAVDAILAAFVAANRGDGTKLLGLGGSGNATPSSNGVIKTTLAGTAFLRSGSLVTAVSAAHGYVTSDLVTVTDINETALRGTFEITRVNDNIFQYTTTSSGALTGSGTANLRKTSTGNTSGFRNYQSLALVTRVGGPWSISINFPA